MMLAEIKCETCAHCSIESTGFYTCPAFNEKKVPVEIMARSKNLECADGYKYLKLSDETIAKRKKILDTAFG